MNKFEKFVQALENANITFTRIANDEIVFSAFGLFCGEDDSVTTRCNVSLDSYPCFDLDASVHLTYDEEEDEVYWTILSSTAMDIE